MLVMVIAAQRKPKAASAGSAMQRVTPCFAACRLGLFLMHGLVVNYQVRSLRIENTVTFKFTAKPSTHVVGIERGIPLLSTERIENNLQYYRETLLHIAESNH